MEVNVYHVTMLCFILLIVYHKIKDKKVYFWIWINSKLSVNLDVKAVSLMVVIVQNAKMDYIGVIKFLFVGVLKDIMKKRVVWNVSNALKTV